MAETHFAGLNTKQPSFEITSLSHGGFWEVGQLSKPGPHLARTGGPCSIAALPAVFVQYRGAVWQPLSQPACCGRHLFLEARCQMVVAVVCGLVGEDVNPGRACLRVFGVCVGCVCVCVCVRVCVGMP